MFSKWLKWEKRQPCPYSGFEVIDVEEVNDLSAEVRSYIMEQVLETRYDINFLEEIAKYLGWDNVRNSIITRGMPTDSKAKRGDFGEILISTILKEFHGYKIPVSKLNFKITRGQSLPATDVLALKIDDGSITEVCFVESKLRASPDDAAAIDGYKQLHNVYEAKLPDILTFVAKRLMEQKDPLFDTFATYMRDRHDTTERDNFRLSLCWEHSGWREKVLENLEENGVELSKFTVHVIRINNLRQITDQVFAELGISEVIDHD